MKNLLSAFAIIALLTGCTSKTAKFEKAVKDRVNKNAMGMDVKYKSLEMKIDTFYAKDIISDFYSEIVTEKIPKDSVVPVLEYLVANAEYHDEQWKMFKWKLSRIKQLQAMQPNDIVYYGISNKYTIDNPIVNRTVTVNYCFVFDKDLKFIADEDADQMEDLNKDRSQKYEFVVAKPEMDKM